jgi:HK97 family phage prohead protease
VGGLPLLTGYLAAFNQWAPIDSVHEGRFLERIEPGSFARTIAENRDRIRVLFNHGHDPSIGDKVLGPIALLEEDGYGARYEVPCSTRATTPT